MNTIPPVDLARQYKLISEEASAAVLDILRSGRYIGGKAVSEFERQFADYVGVNDCVACNSGTDALYLAMRALNIGREDEVITSPFTFIATAETVTLTGATPFFVDIDRSTFNIDLNQLEAAITSQTKAIIPVHLFGQPVNMTHLREIAKRHQLYLIEDCAQATGANWEGTKVGNYSDIGCFSFFPTKNLGACGDGGAITTNNSEIAATIRTVKEHGSRVRYCHELVGINSRLDALQAAILLVKLPYLEDWNQLRRQVAHRYHELLDSLPGIQLPQEIVGGYHVWNQYTILVEDTKLGEQPLRDRLRERLLERGVQSMVYYPLPLHLQPVYQSLGYQMGQFPVSEQVCREVLSLPMFPELSFEEQQQVAYSLKDCLTEK